MKLQIVKGSTSQIITVFIQDSSSTTGAGLAGLVHTSSIVGGYVRAGGTGVALAVDEDVTTEGTYQAPSAAGKVRIGTPANMTAGTYELHFHNDLFAAGANSIFITLGGAANMAVLPLEIQLTNVDLNDGVHGGMTAIPNAAAGEANGLPLKAAAGDFLNVANLPQVAPDVAGGLPTTTKITDARLGVLTDWIDGGRLDLILDIIASVFTGITSLAQWLGAMAGKQTPNSTAQTEIRATGAGSGTFSAVTDSLEGGKDYAYDVYSALNNGQVAIALYVDCLPVTLDGSSLTAIPKTGYSLASTGLDLVTAWTVDITGTVSGNSTLDAAGVRTAIGLASANLDTQLGTVAKTGADSDTLKTLSDQIDGITGGTGTGARTVTVTVNDGVTVLENATVRFTEGGNTYVGSTNASGVVVFSLDDATYAVAISKPGYSFTPTTKVVDGTEADTYSMSAVSITAPPSATTTTGVMTVYDEQGSVESGVTVTVQITAGPGTDGIGYDTTEWAATSSALGVVEFAGIIHGATYKIWRGTSKAKAETFTAPTSGTSFDLPEVSGRG